MYTTKALKGHVSNKSDVFHCLARKKNKKMATFSEKSHETVPP